jgi:hypothetical protein
VAKAVPRAPGRRLKDPGGRPRLVPEGRIRKEPEHPNALGMLGETAEDTAPSAPSATRIDTLVREWLMDLQVLGRSPKTIRWYRVRMEWYVRNGGAQTREELTAFEFKRYLADLQSHDQAPIRFTARTKR